VLQVGFSKGGKLVAFECDFFNNAGNSLDLSGSIMDRCLMHADSGYKIPNVAFRGHMCKMNLPSNTAYRGFGGPQGYMIAEMVIERVAKTLHMPAQAVREMNLYKEMDMTPFGQPLEQSQVSTQCS
jgi:xanthine dehydrogenase/oxidase